MRRVVLMPARMTALALTAALSAGAAEAGQVATRCGSFGCDEIRCDNSGNRCVRFSSYDSYYNGYINRYDRLHPYYGYGGYGGRGGYDMSGYMPYQDWGYGGYSNPWGYSRYGYDSWVSSGGYDGGYGNPGWNGYGGGPGWNGGYGGPEWDGGYGGYGDRLVCDSEGDRCYQSAYPFWNYREYYRLHGYHWDTGYPDYWQGYGY